jgi:hypothetical protein
MIWSGVSFLPRDFIFLFYCNAATAELSQILFGKVLAVYDLRKMIVMVSETALAGYF